MAEEENKVFLGLAKEALQASKESPVELKIATDKLNKIPMAVLLNDIVKREGIHGDFMGIAHHILKSTESEPVQLFALVLVNTWLAAKSTETTTSTTTVAKDPIDELDQHLSRLLLQQDAAYEEADYLDDEMKRLEAQRKQLQEQQQLQQQKETEEKKG